MKRITISLRDYVYSKIFPIDQDISEMNKSARIEELISKGLDKETEEIYKDDKQE